MEDSDELFDVHFYGVNIHLEMKQLIGTIGVYDLKRRLEDEIGYPVGRIRLVYKGKIMTDDSRLLDYNFENADRIQVIILSENRPDYSGAKSIKKEKTMEENLLKNLSKNPLIKEFMKSPEILQKILGSNPHMEEMMQKNPELRNVFQDPSFISQASIFIGYYFTSIYQVLFSNAAQNPELMKEMMRNSDRAISNLEMQPGGFQHLTKMYHSFQKPLESAQMNPFGRSPRVTNEDLALLLNVTEPPPDKINTTPLPNPWNLNNRRRPARTPGLDFSGLPNLSSDKYNRHSQAVISPPISEVQKSLKKAAASNNKDFSTPQVPQTDKRTFQDHDNNTERLSRMSISSLQSISTPQPNTPTFAQNSGSAEPGNSSSSSLKPTNFSNTDTRTESKESRFSRYQSQIQLLSEMGFPNKERNLEALEVTNGDLYLAVEYLARKP